MRYFPLTFAALFLLTGFAPAAEPADAMEKLDIEQAKAELD